MIRRLASLVMIIGLGASAGWLASAAHPGPVGAAGPAGLIGAAGPAGAPGAAGAAGSAASVSQLGVCVSTTFAGTSSYVTGVWNLSRRSDGTTYCAAGSPIDVSPQPEYLRP